VDVWRHFGCATLGEYSYLYLKIDLLLLADVLETFRDVCLKSYAIDPAYYYTAPGMSFDRMLKKTAVKLDLLSDYEILLMFEKGKKNFFKFKFKILMFHIYFIIGIRGELVQTSMRYAKANNEKVPDYDKEKPNSWL
jgi:hypothetical protein